LLLLLVTQYLLQGLLCLQLLNCSNLFVLLLLLCLLLQLLKVADLLLRTQLFVNVPRDISYPLLLLLLVLLLMAPNGRHNGIALQQRFDLRHAAGAWEGLRYPGQLGGGCRGDNYRLSLGGRFSSFRSISSSSRCRRRRCGQFRGEVSAESIDFGHRGAAVHARLLRHGGGRLSELRLQAAYFCNRRLLRRGRGGLSELRLQAVYFCNRRTSIHTSFVRRNPKLLLKAMDFGQRRVAIHANVVLRRRRLLLLLLCELRLETTDFGQCRTGIRVIVLLLLLQLLLKLLMQ